MSRFITSREWGEENGRNGACVSCGRKTWIEFGCAPLCMGCDYPKEPEAPEEPEEEDEGEIRDIGHEQVSQSTDAELAERLLQLVKRSKYSREYHTITSEMYCRAHGIPSVPWIRYCGYGDTALSVIAAGENTNAEWGRVAK